MKQFEATFRIYKHGETDSRPLERNVILPAANREAACRDALALLENPSSAAALLPEYHPQEDVLRISPRRDVRLVRRTRKVALLVDFSVRTRIVADIPCGKSVDEFLEDDAGFDEVVSRARANILAAPQDYLSGDNAVDIVEDEEMPYDPDFDR